MNLEFILVFIVGEALAFSCSPVNLRISLCVSLNHCRAYVPTHIRPPPSFPSSFFEQPVFSFVRSMSRLSEPALLRAATVPRCVANIFRRTRSEHSYVASVYRSLEYFMLNAPLENRISFRSEIWISKSRAILCPRVCVCFLFFQKDVEFFIACVTYFLRCARMIYFISNCIENPLKKLNTSIGFINQEIMKD